MEHRRARPRRRGGQKFPQACRRARRRRNLPAVMFQRAKAASTRRPSARSGVTRDAVLPPCTASRSATAMASASSSGVAASMTASDRSACSACASKAGSPAVCAPQIRRSCGTKRFRHKPFAAARLPQSDDGVAGDVNAPEQSVHGELRMPRRRVDALFLVTGNQSPGVFRRDRCRGPAGPRRRVAAAQSWQ